MDKPKDTRTKNKLLPDLPGYDPGPADGVRVGESPIPGLTLKRILRGHTKAIYRIAWSPDGRFLASPSYDGTIRIWELESGECKTKLEGDKSGVFCVSWSPDGCRLASSSSDNTINIWETETWKTVGAATGHNALIYRVAWSPDGQKLASGGSDGTIRIWDVETWQTSYELKDKASGGVQSLAWSPQGHLLAFGDTAGTIMQFDAQLLRNKETIGKHTGYAFDMVWTSDGQKLISSGGNGDLKVRIWDIEKRKEERTLEGATNSITSVSLSNDERLIAAKCRDNYIRLWSTNDWSNLTPLFESSQPGSNWAGVAFHPSLPILATLGKEDTVIRIWELDMDVLLGQTDPDSVRYTTAKLVLVGDSGVGKTGLGWRLAHGEFKEHASTHGQQFWVVDDLCTTRPDGTECEAVLWDLAGQHVYRPIHAIFLDDVDASLVLFDPTNRQEPLKGAEFWLEQLAQKKELPPSVLVGARLDRGAPVLSREDLAQFCQKHGISGGYIGTSAKEGLGLGELLETLKGQIPWSQMTTTVTTLTFKRVKKYVLGLKEKPDRKNVLVRPDELRSQLEATDPEWEFSDAEMMTAVGHLQTHGYVAVLRSSSGEEHILLTPELLVDLASSIVLQADKHPRELGALNETELLQGRYPFPELGGLEPSESPILLDAAVVRFLEHNICFRETLGNDTLLIFPGLIKQKRPLQDGVEMIDDISYIARGRVENIYSALVVLLGFTRTFTRVNQWQRQAQYEMGEGNICGFRLIEDVEGEIELVLYYSVAMPDYGRRKFQGLFEEFLYQRDVEVTRFPPVLCHNGHLQERSTVVKRLREGKPFLFCEECGKRIELPDIEKQSTVDTPEDNWIQREEALVRLRSTYEAHLTRVKGFRRDRAAPRCCISHVPEQAVWAERLTGDLRDAGIHVIEDRDSLRDEDIILIADTADYQRHFQNNDKAIAADAAIIRKRLAQGKKSTILHLVADSEQSSSASADIRPGDFRNDSHYVPSLFGLVLTLYAIPHNHPAFLPLQKTLHRQWEETLSKLPPVEKPDTKPLKIFISYSHKDEGFKDELALMLESMQRRGIIDAWQDRRIEAGDEWYQAIQTAMNDCNIALLLVSKDFLASSFIRNEEIPHLLQRRKKEGMRLIPIIIRPCLWSSEPILKGLQALPKDGKAVISFPEDNGERDQAWADIAKVIERHALALRPGHPY